VLGQTFWRIAKSFFIAVQWLDRKDGVTMPTRPATETVLLLAMLDDAFNGKGWHGPNLRGILRGVSPADATRRPPNEKHSIADLAVHCAYWKYAARRRLRGDQRGSFPLKGSNWFDLPAKLDAATWKSYLKLLDDQHGQLRAAIEAFPVSQLHLIPAGSKGSNQRLIYGIAAHDVYHAGQIRLIKAMLGRKS
jgi:hypothetical protein